MQFHSVRGLSLAAMLALAGISIASAESPSITLREALSRTLQSNPDLEAYRHTLKAQDGRIQQAGLQPNPMLSVNAENVFGSGATRGLDRAEITLSMSQLIELGGLRESRLDVARRAGALAGVEGHVQRLDVLAETARRFVSLVSQQEAHRLTHLAVALAERTERAVRLRVSAAKSPLAEGDRALVALERARNADAHAEHELQAVRYELAAAWGASQPDFGEAAADLYTLAPTGTYEELLVALDGTPDIARYLSEARLREAEIELALARRNPGVELGAGIRRDRADDDTSLLLSFGMPLPIRDRNQGLIAESRAQREAALAGHQAARVRARTQLYRHHQELLDRRREVGMLRERALPRMESALRHTEYAYERGRYSYLEWVDAQRELLDVKRDLIGAATQYHLTLIEIERLTGVAVSRGGF